MANAFQDAGYVVGVFGTIFIGILCTYCIHQLISAEYELCKRKKVPSMNYVSVTENAFLEGPKICQKLASKTKYEKPFFTKI
jgi:solute carrier family 36 (proton-coupled amino acid transporter)